MRILKTANEVIDLMSQMRGGAKVAVGYISSAKLPKTIESLDKNTDEKNGWNRVAQSRSNFDDDTYNSIQSLKGLGRKGKYSDIGIKGIVKLSQFTTNWQTDANFRKNAANFEKAREDFLIDHGATQSDIDDRRRQSHYQKQEYGNNGIMTGKYGVKVMLNPVTNTNAKYQYFIIDDNGDTSRPLSKAGVQALIQKTPSDAPLISVLDNVDNSEEVKQEYREWCKALQYGYSTYSLDNILYLTGTVDGEKFFFFNNLLTSQIDNSNKDLKINPQVFLQIAKEQADKLSVDMSWADELPESRRRKMNGKIIKENKKYTNMKNTVRLTESNLRNMIKESVKRVLSEGSKSNQSHNKFNNVKHSDFYKEGNKYAMDIHDGENSSTVYASKRRHLKDEVKNKGYKHDNSVFDNESNFKKKTQTENRLRNKIKESIHSILKEGTTDSYVTDKFFEAVDIHGAETIINAIYAYLNCDDLEQIVQWLIQDEYIEE